MATINPLKNSVVNPIMPTGKRPAAYLVAVISKAFGHEARRVNVGLIFLAEGWMQVIQGFLINSRALTRTAGSIPAPSAIFPKPN